MNNNLPKKPKKLRRKRCKYCGGFFYPDPRVGERQKSCTKEECRKKRKQESQRKWMEKNRDYFKGRYPELRERLKDHPKKKKDTEATLKVLKSIFIVMNSQISLLAEVLSSFNIQDKKLKKFQRNQEIIKKFLQLLEDKKS